MQNADWTNILNQIPTELQCQLMVVLNNRAEIAVETIYRVESPFVVLRGRMGGTTEDGLMFVLPYDQLSGVYLTRGISDADVEAMFSAPLGGEKTSGSAQGTAERPAPDSSTGKSTPAVPSFGRAPEATSIARNNLLERLRAARQAAAPQSNGK
jgi:hypothetical protein